MKLITCIVTQPISLEMIRRLKEEKNIITANTTHARGSSSQSEFVMKAEEILTVLVSPENADEIFNYLYKELQLFEAHRGIIYQEAVSRASDYTLPSLS